MDEIQLKIQSFGLTLKEIAIITEHNISQGKTQVSLWKHPILCLHAKQEIDLQGLLAKG